MADGAVVDHRSSWARHAEAPLHQLRDGRPEREATPSRLKRVFAVILDYLPRGNTLDAPTFAQRHLLLCWVLFLHLPSLFLFAVWQGYGAGHSMVEIATPAACLVLGRLARNRRLAAFFVTAGLVFCSSVLVHLSGGTIEAHFHFFILIGLIALYQDWVPFLWDVVFTVLSHGLGSVTDVESMYNHYAAQNRPWLWAFIHGIAVLAGCAGVMIFWRSTEVEQQRNSALVAELSDTEVAAAQREASQRQSISELLVNLARRNQSLMDRQLQLIAELEQREREPEALADLFHLDHLATRIRRNAESLLVLSGDEPPRRWGRPVPLAEVVRAAAAEVEDYRRVEVLVNDHLEVAGRAVADLSHLLAELIENATMFSPPSSQVRVRSHLAPIEPPAYVLSVEDSGIGMTEPDLKGANAVLAAPTEVDLRRSRLGFNVVSRLAHRYGLRVHLAHTPGGGITALVTLPDDLVSVRPPAPPLPPPPPPPPLPPAPPPPPPLPARVGGPLDQEPWPSAVISDMPMMDPDATPAPRWAVPAAGPVARAMPDIGEYALPTMDPDATPAPRSAVPAAGPVASAMPETGEHAVPTMDPDATPAPSWAVPAAGPMTSSAARAISDTGDQAAVGFQITGRPPVDQVVDDEPLPPPPPPPPTPVAPGNGEADEAAATLGGLARRVPGAALATSLRRDANAAAEPPNGAGNAWPPGFPQDRERVGSMLSRFQAGLRDGRAAVEAESEPAAPDAADAPDAPDAPEDDS